MAYTDDAVNAKLSSLNETQESIVTVAQWIMFHRRHADRTGQLWLQKLKDSGAGKRLNLIYLANEVVQQSKARKKEDFLIAFSPIIAEATATAYKGAINEVQGKVRRVVEVWRQRQIFEIPIQESVEARINELDKNRSSSKKPLLGGSIFSSSSGGPIPTELQPLVTLQTSTSKAAHAMGGSVTTANADYNKLMDPEAAIPTPPVHAARLSALLKSLATAEGAVSESIKARRDLIGGLEKLLETNRTALVREETQHQDFADRKSIVETKKREVEDGIMRGLSMENLAGTYVDGTDANGNGDRDSSIEPDRPEMEELTPPPVEQVTPVGSPFPGEAEESEFNPAEPTPADYAFDPEPQPAHFDLLSSLAVPSQHSYVTNGSEGAASKKRKMEPESEFVDYASGETFRDLNDDVDDLLRTESGGR